MILGIVVAILAFITSCTYVLVAHVYDTCVICRVGVVLPAPPYGDTNVMPNCIVLFILAENRKTRIKKNAGNG